MTPAHNFATESGQPHLRRQRGFVMDRVTVDLNNCYGIKKLRHTFDFSQTSAYALYAPNGVMKSSFAQTFQDIAAGVPSVDRIFLTRPTARRITDQAGNELVPQQVLVLGPYNEQLAPNEKTSTLLVDDKLRKEYAQLHVEIDKAAKALLTAIKTQAKSKADFESEISSAFTSGDDLKTALTRIRAELEKQTDTPFADVQYDKVFDAGILSAIDDKNIKGAIEDYVRRYNELLAGSTFFKKGTFDYYNAGQIATSLAKNGFFNAKHTVRLNATNESVEITTQADLEAVITREKDAILKDKKLRKTFDDVARALDRNVTLRDFRMYMLDHESYLSQLNNVPKFKENVLKSYLKVHYDLYSALMKAYEVAEKRARQIEQEAAKQQTRWRQVIGLFNERFVVPFELEAKNYVAVALGHAPIVELAFTYRDNGDSAAIDKDSLLKSLSTGEKKALYILNAMFEIETRRKANQETLVVIDDLADSFDYQNKYAIIQYLKDISEDGLFKQIIMTHNFDFFRTIESRFVGYSNCLMATKSKAKGLALTQALGIRNVFVNDWKKHFYDNPKKKIASVPFLRNLVEYSIGEADPKYLKLTSILHWKSDSAAITVGDLDNIYQQICGVKGTSSDSKKPIHQLIAEQAGACLTAPIGANFENKIVLAIAIRLAAEQFMVNKIADSAFVDALRENQSHQLAAKFKEKFANDSKSIEALDRVLLMTPENLHLNSFMYEPLVDMSDEHLRTLYEDISTLSP
jgi:ABC-type lipoprotein export system ATPase subunit